MKVRAVSLYLLPILLIVVASVSVNAQKLKILPMGNSITWDYNTNDEDGSPRPSSERLSYRYKLYQLLNASGYTWDYIGNEECGSPSLPYSTVDSLDYSDNAGFPGITPEQLITVLNTGRDPRDNTCLIEWKLGGCNNNYLQKYSPDIILLHIGTNMLDNHADAESHKNAVNTILDIVDQYEISAGKPVIVFLAQIINRESASGAAEHEPTMYYNSLLVSLVANRPTDKLVLVNMETGAGISYKNISSGGDMYDTWHPAPSGYEKMANKWYAAIANYNLRTPIVGNIPDVSFTNGQSSVIIDLNPYVFDPQDPDNEIVWSTLPSSLKFNISFSNGIATITSKNPAESATETVTFKAQDSGHGGTPLFDTDELTITYTFINQKPIILDHEPFVMNEDGSLTLSLLDLEVDDDNNYPDDFTLYVLPGANYSVINNYTISPSANFNGSLTVPVYVNDGLINSDTMNLIVNVIAVNDAPIILGPSKNFSTPINVPLEISLDDLIVTDFDNNYPDDFTLSINQGTNYTVTGDTITPVTNFTGTLHVSLKVNDGTEFSEPVTVDVIVEAPPQSGQVEISNSLIKNLYPNPATTQLNIEFNVSSNYKIQLVDVTGKIWVNEDYNNLERETISLHSLPSGLYLLRIVYSEGVYMEKVIVY